MEACSTFRVLSEPDSPLPGRVQAYSVSVRGRKVERSHRIDSEGFCRLLEGQVIDDVNLFNDKLQEWEDYYNYDRPHGALAGSTPYERLKQKTQDPLS
jgi:transposase InsO family protein